MLTTILLITAWLVAGTGLASDDLVLALAHQEESSGSWWPTLHTIAFPLEHYTHTLAYHYFGTRIAWGYEFLKALYATLAVWMTARFFSLYLDSWRASVAAFVFVFMPNHDAAVFWFIGQYLVLSIAAYCYGFYLIRREKPVLGTLLCTLASFISYGSTPIAVGLSLLALFEKQRRSALLVLLPNVVYTIYYFVVSIGLNQGPQRLPSELNLSALARQFLLQLASFVDAQIGPSFWLKTVFSIPEASALGFLLGGAALAVVWTQRRETGHTPGYAVVASLSVMVLLALGMFAVTGKYPQIAFNLGDRVSIYGSLLISYCLLRFVPGRVSVSVVFAVVFLSAAGISSHWTRWTDHQNALRTQVADNDSLRTRPPGVLLVSGNQYSRLGPFSHIEFLSENYVVNSVFKTALGEDSSSHIKLAINHRHSVEGSNLVDHKYGESTSLDETVLVYDSQRDKLQRIARNDLNAYIDALPQDNRHWVQTLPPGWIRDLILKLMPRLKYAF